jgi:hypothetical protein
MDGMLPAENGGGEASREAVSSGQFADAYCRRFLITHQNPDGGWGYHPALPSSVEATSWALVALTPWSQAAELAEACARARAWLLSAQLPNGSWPAFPGQRQGCWTTSLAALALQLQGAAPSAVLRGLDWLLDAWPAEATLWWRLRQFLARSAVVHQDSSLSGWSWTPGTASWVEPTSYALLLLRSLPADLLPRRAMKRRWLAERMLYDRMCPGGGWNSGNPLVYGVAGVPRVGPTVWALLALIDQAERVENQMSVDWLARAYDGIKGAASLVLAHRCLAAYGRHVPPLAPTLGELYLRNRFFESVLAVAWILLAWSQDRSGAGHVTRERPTS